MLDAQDTARLLPYPALVEALRAAALGVAQGQINCPRRQVIEMPGGGKLLSMAAVAGDVAVHKLIAVTPRNAARGLPTVQGLVSVLDAVSGTLLLTLDGATVTGRRTAALSMLGVLALLPARPRCVRIYGTGMQALHHLQAVAALFPAARLQVCGRTKAAGEKFRTLHAREFASLLAVEPGGAAGDTDVIIACTTSSEPVYGEPARAGRLIIAVGAFTPGAAEIAADTVRGSAMYVDDLVNARQEAGDLIRAGVDWAQVQPLAQALGEGGVTGEAVLFKTVGSAAWDLAAARVALATAATSGA